ncbi:MAG: glycosyltransferase [Candidatus Helarchaeota archaeon]
MKICYFGTYNKEYNRNSVFLEGLRLNKIYVKEINFKKTMLNYFKNSLKLIKNDIDIIIVGWNDLSWIETIISKITTKKPVIWDALISLYNSEVFDRKKIKINSLRSNFIYYREFYTLKFANCVILDTYAHINYFKKLFPNKKVNYERVFVGANDKYYKPIKKQKSSDKLIVSYIGTYIPLHGVKYILKAARLLEKDKEIIFELYGKGQMYEYIKLLHHKMNLRNVKLVPIMFRNPIKENEYLNSIDISLGIFGTSEKANIVIPTKIFNSLASARPIITRESDAIKEVFQDASKYLTLCKKGDARSLADAILLLKDDKKLRNKIAIRGYNFYKTHFTPKKIGKSIIEILNKYIK